MVRQSVFGALTSLSLLAAAQASAADQGFYVGGSIGQSSIDVDDVDFDESDTAFKLLGGFAFNPYFAVELAYVDGGSPDKSFGAGASVDVSFSGINSSAVGRIPIGDMFKLFGKLGYSFYDWEVKGRVSGTTVVSADDSESDLSYGIGAALAIGETFELRAEYEALDVDGGDVNIISVGGVFKF